MKVKKVLEILLLGGLLMSCSGNPVGMSIMTFEMYGDCWVSFMEMPSKGESEIIVMKRDALATKGNTKIYGYWWDTEFSYKQDTVFFKIPQQQKSRTFSPKQGLRAEGWIYGEDMYIEYRSWKEGYEGAINCEVFGKQK